MHARSALFDLYGDHLRSRGGRAPVAALVRMLAALDVTAPAVRTAISRMVRQGWLAPVRMASGPGYQLTDRADARLDDAASRIYRTRQSSWGGSWDLLVISPVSQRSARERIRAGLGFLGYAALSDSTWISPFASSEIDALLDGEPAQLARFEARDDHPATRAEQAWDLDALGAAYSDWRAYAAKLVADPASLLDGVEFRSADERSFGVRSLLVHEWRKFLFTDPGLPSELLPDDWAGHDAARFFAEEAARLLPAANRFVDDCLANSTTDIGTDRDGDVR
jgi:phenylacetic acid degradation operon negative regulatory protein